MAKRDSAQDSRPPGAAPAVWRPWPLAALLLLTLVVRGSVLVAMYDRLADDPDAYREIAENILQHGVYGLGKDGQPRPTAYRPPLYPILLTKVAFGNTHVGRLPVALLHLVLGMATVWLTYVVASAMGSGVFGGKHPGDIETPNSANDSRPLYGPFLAGLLVACDPILLNQSALVMTETLAAFLAILSLYCLVRFDAARTPFNAALTGGAIGLAILSRPTFLPWLGLVALVFIALKIRWPIRLANVAGILCVAAIVLAPWTVRNYRLFGKPIATTTHGGYTFFLANNKAFFYYLQTDDDLPFELSLRSSGTNGRGYVMPHATPAERMKLNLHFARYEINDDRRFYEWAGEHIAEMPGSFAHACLYRLRQLWSPLPHKLTADESLARRLLRYAVAAWYVGVYLLAAAGVYRLRWKVLRTPWMYGLLLCLVFTAVHTFYWSNLRMRAPLMPFVALVAAAGVGSLRRKSTTQFRDT